MNSIHLANKLYLQGNRRLGHQDFAAAIADFSAALNVRPDYPEAYNNRGVARQGQQDWEGALADYTKALRINPRYPHAYYNRSVARRILGDCQGAVVDCDQALALRPNYAEALNNRALARWTLEEWAGALADATEALRVRPDYADAFNTRGLVKLDQEDYLGAVADFDEAIRIEPNHTEAYGNRVDARSALKDFAGAGEDCANALTLNPQRSEFHGLQGAIHLGQRDFVVAISDYNHALEQNPRLFWAYLLRGNAHYHLGEQGDMYADYKRAFQVNPRLATSHIVRRFVREIRANPTAELAECEEHLQSDPGDLFTYARRGLTLLFFGKDAEAEADLEQFRRRCPEDAGYLQEVIDRVLERREKKGLVSPPVTTLDNYSVTISDLNPGSSSVPGQLLLTQTVGLNQSLSTGDQLSFAPGRVNQGNHPDVVFSTMGVPSQESRTRGQDRYDPQLDLAELFVQDRLTGLSDEALAALLTRHHGDSASASQ